MGVLLPEKERNGEVGMRGEVYARRRGVRWCWCGVMIAEPSSGVGGLRGELEAEDEDDSISHAHWTTSGGVRRGADAEAVRVVPWMVSQQSSHTRAARTRETGDSKSVMGTLRGGLRNSR